MPPARAAPHGRSVVFCAPVIRLFACGKSFPHSDRFTIRIPALFFPQVENPVEKVQSSSVQACFPGGIPHFPQGFPQSYLDRLRTLHTFCNFQVRIMTNFEAERHLFCLFIQHHFDECGFLLKIVCFGASAAGLAGCCRSLYEMLHPTYFSVFRAHRWPRKLRFGYKNSPVD